MKLPPMTATMLRDFENCPHKAYRRYVLKDLKWKRTEAMEKGTADHKAIENRLQKGIALDSHLRCVEPICDYFSTLPDHVPVRTEYYVGILADGSPCATSHSACWLRVKADLVTMTMLGGWLVDWKTGRRWEDPFELECQALVCSAHHNEVPSWCGQYFWLQDRELGEMHMLDPYDTYQKVAQAYADMVAYDAQKIWPIKPNTLCNWCDVADCAANTNPELRK